MRAYQRGVVHLRRAFCSRIEPNLTFSTPLPLSLTQPSYSAMSSSSTAAPLLSPASASICSLLLTSAYVGSLYLSKTSRISHQAAQTAGTPAAAELERQRLGRDHPEVIQARLKAVGGATVACCFGVAGIVQLGLDQAQGLESVRLLFSFACYPSGSSCC